MKRKIIRQGHNTLTITLPVVWAEKLNLKAGDEIDVVESKGSLIVNGKQHDEEKRTEIDIRGLNVPMIWRFFQSAYREGYTEIKVLFDPSKKFYEGVYNYYTSQFAYARMGEKPKQHPAFEMLQELVNRFVGVEIIDTGEDYCVIKQMGEITSKEFENSLRRIFLLLQELFEKVINLIKEDRIGDINVCKTLHQMDINIDRFIDYCCRINNQINDSTFQKNKPLMFSTLFLLELLGDEFKYIGTHLAMSKRKVSDVIQFAERVKEHFDLYYKLFYKFDKDMVSSFGENDSKIYNDHFKWKDSQDKEGRSIKRHLMQISKFIFCLMELRVEMEYSQ